jgi:hypothetical protein
VNSAESPRSFHGIFTGPLQNIPAAHNGALDRGDRKVTAVMAETNNIGTRVLAGSEVKCAEFAESLNAILDVCREKPRGPTNSTVGMPYLRSTRFGRLPTGCGNRIRSPQRNEAPAPNRS